MDFIPVTGKEQQEMLAKIGRTSVAELFSNMKPALGRELKLSRPLTEFELRGHMSAIEAKNTKYKATFRGAGAYNHYMPSPINHMLLRGEFYTAYTPYQAEISQGTLQAIYEFQTYICRLTGMDAANASMYEGASAAAEIALIANAKTQRGEIVIVPGVHPQYGETLKTYCDAHDMAIRRGLENITDKTAAVVVQNPNYYGEVEELAAIGKAAKEKGAVFAVIINEASSLALLEPPGKYGADIVVGEAQALGNPVGYGGPYLGFMACKNEFIRRMPGRLSGMSVDAQGRRGFTLTLQAREQHIRREKATSNLCTNEALLALASTIYLALMGPKGFRDAAKTSYKRAHELEAGLRKIGFTSMNSKPFYNEFRMKSPVDVAKLNTALHHAGYLGPLDLGNNEALFCCTEMVGEEDISELVSIAKNLK